MSSKHEACGSRKEQALLSPQHCRAGPESPIRRSGAGSTGRGGHPSTRRFLCWPRHPRPLCRERAEDPGRGGRDACWKQLWSRLQSSPGKNNKALPACRDIPDSKQAAGLTPGPCGHLSQEPEGLKQDTQLGEASVVTPTTGAGAGLALTVAGADEANGPVRASSAATGLTEPTSGPERQLGVRC